MVEPTYEQIYALPRHVNMAMLLGHSPLDFYQDLLNCMKDQIFFDAESEKLLLLMKEFSDFGFVSGVLEKFLDETPLETLDVSFMEALLLDHSAYYYALSGRIKAKLIVSYRDIFEWECAQLRTDNLPHFQFLKRLIQSHPHLQDALKESFPNLAPHFLLLL